MSETLKVLRTLKEMDALRDYLEDKEFVAYDCETTGVTKESEIIGFSVCAEEDKAFYVVLSEWRMESKVISRSCNTCSGTGAVAVSECVNETCNECAGTGSVSEIERVGRLTPLETIDGTKSFLEYLCGKSLIMHNAVFDCSMARNNFKVDLMPSVHTDTMLLAHLTDENRRVGLKDLGVSIFGENSKDEQSAMKESVSANGGVLTKEKYEMYKCDSEIMGRYGAKDTILTLKLFFHLVPELYKQGLNEFFYSDETMPQLRGPTYDLNTEGLKVDVEALQNLKASLEAEIIESKAFIYQEIDRHIRAEFPGTTKANTFSIGSNHHLAWLLYVKLGHMFHRLTPFGREVSKHLPTGKTPYADAAKRKFIEELKHYRSGCRYCLGTGSKTNKKQEKYECTSCGGKGYVFLTPHKLMCVDEPALSRLAGRYKWVERLLSLKSAEKILSTYVIGIQERMQYGTIRPSFLQHGTTSGRYSSRDPNFQNLPKDDKRVKRCIIARPGKVFVGADQSQLEPRVFAAVSGDETLINCFAKGEDFYSVVGAPIFGKNDCSLFKDEPNSFASLYSSLRDRSKVLALATPYGRTAFQQAEAMDISTKESQELIDRYFEEYPKVEGMMLESHEMIKKEGVVYSLFGRPRRVPEARNIERVYGKKKHSELPYQIRSLLNLAMNHRVQSTGASIINRSAIRLYRLCRELEAEDPAWAEVKQVMNIHDELVIEAPEHLAQDAALLLKIAMETTVQLPGGVGLIAVPKIATNLADLK